MAGSDQVPAVRQRASTRERLIDAAVQMCGERGIEATSLRALTEAAGSNIAAVNYHFGSKEGLLRAVIDQAMRAVNEERRVRLEQLEAAPQPPSVAALVRAFVTPGVGLAETHGSRGPDIARFIGRVMGEPNARVREIFAQQVEPVEGRYLTALRHALPELDERGVQFAYAGMVGLLGVYQSGTFATLGWAPETDDGTSASGSGAADCERLVAFITGGILATLPTKATDG
ncbi:TetR family transcriptional regulator [Streptomyces bathyalis]|uniref:TetR family transcriptional regulator n=1 Tax=Streptomyces bathyalis TaxID=2710756 RepID=A0A7T1WVQ0_9ACTN|nr:TetR family transcriptional regulator [Streptomyces bathyalis]QPP09205.1 TetR family transcriptional regulator [Streptomyces bathyalis]